TAVIAIALVPWTVISHAQGTAPAPEALQVRPNFYMIAGAGANIGAQIGPNGVVLVNAGTADAADAVVAAIAKVTNQPVRYIIDTSADPDVIGGNGKIARAGRNGPEHLECCRPWWEPHDHRGERSRHRPSPLA